MADSTVEEAVIRNCEALIAGNIVQIFADMSPQAMMKLSQSMAAPMSGGATAPPKLTAYEIAGRSRMATATSTMCASPATSASA
jgi:hypothetical protein